MRKSLFALILFVFAAMPGLAQGYQPVLGDTSGYTEGGFAVTDGGASTYRFSPVITPGTAALQPTISFAYNSQGGNGLMGLGWSIEGLSTISRAAQTKSQDGRIKGISFSNTDRFALDGERLILTDTNNTYGGNGVEYRTEQNAIYRITSFGSGTTPGYFKVENKAGLIMEYGNSTDSKVIVNGTTVIHWLLNRISDRYGNYITFSYYQNPTTGEYYPLQIDYTGNINTGLLPHASLKFEYENRIDSVQRYLSGLKIANSTKRLKAFKCFYGTTQYRSYTFNYSYSPANLSELISFQECGLNNRCNAPTNFLWANIGALTFSTTNITNVQLGTAQNKIFSTDLNGDAVQDIVRVVQGGNLELYASNRSVSSLAFSSMTFNPSISVASKLLLADFNGDGKQDFLRYDSSNGSNSICINTTASGAPQIANNQTSSPIPTSLFSNNKQVVVVDINGDGRTDILTFDVAGGGSNYWMFSTSTGAAGLSFEPNSTSNYFSNLIPLTYFNGTYQPYFTDLNGDGLIDLLFFNPTLGSTVVYQNDGGTIPSFTQVASNIITPSALTALGGKLMLADMNADNLPDVVYYVKSSGANSWWINKGNNTFIAQSSAPSSLASSISGGDYLLQLDFNSDGFTDLVWMDKASGANRWFVNDGKLNFSQLSGTIIPTTELAGYDLQGIGNFTSRSTFDLFLFKDTKTPRAKILKGNSGANSLISQISCGNGQVTDISYDFLTNDSLYTPSDSAQYPLMDYRATQIVVKNFQVDNGIGGKNRVSYHYAGAKMHMSRGFRGCSEVQEKDETTGITETRTYQADSNSWKYINSPLIKSVKRLANGTIISQTDVQNGLKTYFSGKCYFSYVISSTTKNYETNGNFVDSVRTSNQYDDYGNVISTVTDYGGGMKDSLVNVIYNFANDWVLGRLSNSHLYRMAPSKPTITKASAFDYDAITGALTRETTESDSGATVKIIKSYVRDAFGNILRDTIAAWNGSAIEKRVTITAYDSLGRFPISITNALGHTATKTYDPLLGHEKTATTPNSHTTTQLRDNTGRLIKIVNHDGTWSTQDYRKCGGAQSCPINATHLIWQQSSNNPPVVTYYNLLNQVVRSRTTGFNGTFTYVDKTYDNRGLLISETEPYFSTGTPNTIQYFYDELGRPVRTIRPGSRIDSVKYNGHTTITINALGQSNTIVKDAKGNIVTTIDNQGNILTLDHDAANRRIKTTDPFGNNIKWEYDIWGNMVKEDDPDRGITLNKYNGFGELISTTRGTNVTTMKYDSGSRIKERVAPEGTTKWYYDGQARGKGLVDSVVHYNGNKETVGRDSLGRDTVYTKRIDGRTFIKRTAYDSIGRPKRISFHTGFSLSILYNPYGYQHQVKNTVTGVAYYTATVINAKGQLEQLLYGNGTQVNKVYDPNTNYLTGTDAKKGAATLLDLSFTHDAIGNLTQRKDLLQNKQEDFWLDNLNRLTKTKVLNGDSVLIQYNSIGNITSKSDVGTYTYGGVNAGPHQVIAVTGPNAACVPSLLVSTKYNSFDKVREISKDSTLVTVTYDAGYQRNLQKMWDSSKLVRVKVYAFPELEQEIKGGDTITTHFIQGPDGVVATYVTHTKTGLSAGTFYYHRDHLGSAVMITNDTGGVAAKFSFDAWGRRRNSDWSTQLTDTAGLLADRGFTGHEHLDLFELIDCNGRIYDPVLGRFTSPDPVIQDVYDLQVLNRYSYCANNPLSFVDPSGHSFFSKIFKQAKQLIHEVTSFIHNPISYVKDNWKMLASLAIGYFLPISFSIQGIWGAVLSGAANGFASTVSATLLSGGNVGDALRAGIKGAVITAAVGGATFKVNGLASNLFERTVGNGVVQGVASVANGGDFLHGFYSTATDILSTSLKNEVDNQFTTLYAKVAAKTIIAGTKTAMSGGSFVNGAASESFKALYAEVKSGQTFSLGGYYIRGIDMKDKGSKVGVFETNIFLGENEHLSVLPKAFFIGSNSLSLLHLADDNLQETKVLKDKVGFLSLPFYYLGVSVQDYKDFKRGLKFW